MLTLAAVLALAALVPVRAAAAEDRLVDIPTRPGVKVGYWLMPREGATATVVLLPGGEGGIGYKGGAPTSSNFLVRMRDRFAAAGFNVAVVGKPSDQQDMTLAWRTGDDHMQDLRIVVERLKRDLGKPVWLVGTSRGSTSAAAAGIALGDAVAGVVLSSSVTDGSVPGAVQNLPLAELRVPVLVVHHRNDACRLTPPMFAARIYDGLVNAKPRKLVMMQGGSGVRGEACQPLHYHGYIGIEAEAVDAITDFVRAPKE
jgi:hypothetical protein